MIHLKGTYYNLYADMLEQTHLLVGGRTGAGKSTIINALLTTVLIKNAPSEKSFILLDAKGTELWDYRKVPHTLYYGCSHDEILQGLDVAKSFCDKRFKENRRKGMKIYDGADIYVVIDELASLSGDKQALTVLKSIMELGRAVKIHVIAGTQNFLSSCIPTTIKVNFTAVCGLQTRSATDSRVLIGCSGCESLPNLDYESGIGQCIYQNPKGQFNKVFHVIYEDEIQGNIQHWLRHTGILGFFRGIFNDD